MSKRAKLSEVATLITKGTTPSTIGGRFVDSGINFIKSESICDSKYLKNDIFEHIDEETDKKLKRSKLAEGDLLFSIAGAYLGKIGIVRKRDLPANTNQAVGIVRVNQNLANVDYVYYYFSQNHVNDYINNLSSQSSQPNLNLELLGNLEFEVKDLLAQQKIAAVLSALDAKIDLNNRINAELESMAKTLYDYWFVQFDFPNAEGKPYKTSGSKMVWNEELKREIPAGWEVDYLGEVVSIARGASPRPIDDFIADEGMPWVKISDATSTDNRFILETKQYIVESGVPKSRQVTPNTLILSNSASPAIPRIVKINACVHDGWIVIDNYKKCLTKEFMYHYFEYERPRIICLGSGSIFQNLKTDYIKNLKIVLPDEKVLQNLTPKFETLSEAIYLNLLENQRLAALRDWLLPMLMNGQVTVGSVSQSEAENSAVAQPEILFIADNKKAFAKQVLGGKIVSLFQNDPHFTSIKFQKIQYLAEHIAEADLNWNYYYQAAGPYDNVFMHTITDKLKAAQWFEKQGSRYIPLSKQEQIDGYYQGFFKPVIPRLDQLFSLMANLTDIEAEIIATLYAVWNNRIILNQPITEELLMEDFYHWSERKLLYTQEQLQQGLQWMKMHSIIPTGFGKELKKAKEKVKH